jgi:hypothetical protein
MDGCAAFARSVVCLVVLGLVSGCGTTQLVTLTGSRPLESQVAVGDTVEIGRQDGERLRFKVREVSSQGLRGPDVFVPTGDIGSLKIVEGVHPAMVAFGVLLIGAAVWMVADPEDVCGDWPAKPCDEAD